MVIYNVLAEGMYLLDKYSPSNFKFMDSLRLSASPQDEKGGEIYDFPYQSSIGKCEDDLEH